MFHSDLVKSAFIAHIFPSVGDDVGKMLSDVPLELFRSGIARFHGQ